MPTALLQSGVRTWHRARRRHCVMQQQQQQLTARSSPLGGGFPLGCCLAAVVLRGRARLFGKPQGAEARGDLWGGDSAPSKGLQCGEVANDQEILITPEGLKWHRESTISTVFSTPSLAHCFICCSSRIPTEISGRVMKIPESISEL